MEVSGGRSTATFRHEIWVFPVDGGFRQVMGVPPSSRNLVGFSHGKPCKFLGYLHLWKPPVI